MSELVTLDSISFATPETEGRIIVCGSHGGLVAAKHASQFLPKCVIFNDAGRGKRQAGIAGIYFLDKLSIIAATVDTMTAMIGDAADSYQTGILSAVNQTAYQNGLCPGMSVRQAVKILQEGRGF